MVSNIRQTLRTTWASGINVLQQMTLYATTMLEFNVPGRQSCSSSNPAVLYIYVFVRCVFLFRFWKSGQILLLRTTSTWPDGKTSDEVPISTFPQAQAFCSRLPGKQMASTAMNIASSRSHSVLILSLLRRCPGTRPLLASQNMLLMEAQVSTAW